jgi:hypothetical protein
MRIGHVSKSLRLLTSTSGPRDRWLAIVAILGSLAGLLPLVGCSDDDSSGAAGTGSSQAGSAASSAGGAPAAGSGGSGTGAGGLSPTKLVGTFNLRLVPGIEASGTAAASAAQSAFIGSVADGPTPTAMAWLVDQEANGCTLYVPKSPFCDPGCGSSAVCVSDDTCVERPTSQTVGTIRLTGVGSSEVVMTPIAGNYQPKGGTALAFPPCMEGAEVKLAADGGTFTPFTLSAKCIAELDFKGPIKIVKGSALKLTWKAPGQAALARIQVRLDISHHGGARGKIECDVADSGSLEMPAVMVDKLVDLGVAGFPTVVVTRIASGGVASGEPKQVVLNVQESVEREVQIDGLVSCADSTDCPAPKTCQSDLTCK